MRRPALRLRTSKVPKGDDEAKRLFGFHLRAVRSDTFTWEIHEEYAFAKDEARNHRWDFALPQIGLAIEINGGIWTRGAHGHPQDILRNMEKTNLAAALGWRVLAFSPEQVKNGLALAFTLATIERLERLLCSNLTRCATESKAPFLTRLPALGGVKKRRSAPRSYSAPSSSSPASSQVTRPG